MKKIVTLFVAIAAFCGFTSKAEEATTFEVNRIKYTVTGENSVGVSGLNENYEPGEVKLTEVIIPSTVENAGKTIPSLRSRSTLFDGHRISGK